MKINVYSNLYILHIKKRTKKAVVQIVSNLFDSISDDLRSLYSNYADLNLYLYRIVSTATKA